MTRTNASRKVLQILAATVILLTGARLLAQVPLTAPAPNRNLTVPLQKRQPPAQPQKQFPGARAQAPIPAPAAGTVEGFVFWPTSAIAHKPPSTCSGLAITVSVGSSNGPFTAYTPMATLSNNFKYVGQVKETVTATQTDLFDVCTYGYNHVPVGPDLQVKLTITQPMAFTPVATPQFSVVGPVKIVNGQCNMLPNVVNPSPSDMLAHWGSCQNMAYNVNFILVHPMMLHTVSAGTGGSGAPSGGAAPQGGMLSGSQQRGMLAPKSTPGLLNGSSQPSQGQNSGTAKPGSKQMMNPQPLPPQSH